MLWFTILPVPGVGNMIPVLNADLLKGDMLLKDCALVVISKFRNGRYM